jgi:hypothetical protein
MAYKSRRYAEVPGNVTLVTKAVLLPILTVPTTKLRCSGVFKDHMRFDTPEEHNLHSVNAYLRYSDEALALRITEKFLAEVGRATLRYTPEMFDVSAIKHLLGEIRSEVTEANPDSKKILEDRLRNELDRWRNVLAKRDSSVQAYEIRRFHDSLRGSIDPSILVRISAFLPLDAA